MLPTFQKPMPNDRVWTQSLLAAEPTMACDYNYSNIYLWSRVYPQEVARQTQRLLVRVQGRLGNCYLYPLGSGPLVPAVEALSRDASARGVGLRLVCVTAEQKERLEVSMPGRFRFESDRDSWDYIYDIDRLADLSGKKLHSKRNHIHRFEEQCPDWTFEQINRANVPECVALEWEWAAVRANESQARESVSEESIAVIEALYHMDELGMKGGLVRSAGKVVAFSLGSFLGAECFDVQFEKARSDVQGAYTIINREMARMIRSEYPQIKWLNREDDLGLEGLRKAKLSYYPDILLEKYVAYANK